MKTHFRNKSKYCTTGASNHNIGNINNNNSSNLGPGEVSIPIPTTNIRSVADVVDSSDEHYMRNHYRCEWNREIKELPQQQRRASKTTTQPLNRAKNNPNVYSKNQERCKKPMPSMYKERHCRDKLKVEMKSNDDEETNEQMLAGDYKLMSEMPISIGGHFQFASEKHWTAADSDEQSQLERTEASEYFTLNLKLLNLGLKTIPFYKRLDYPANLFNCKQIEAMEKLAESAEKAYQPVLEDHIQNPRSLKNGATKQENEKNKEQKAEDTANENSKAAPITDELDELLNMTETTDNLIVDPNVTKIFPENNASVRPTTASDRKNGKANVISKNDIEDWLDNVLEE